MTLLPAPAASAGHLTLRAGLGVGEWAVARRLAAGGARRNWGAPESPLWPASCWQWPSQLFLLLLLVVLLSAFSFLQSLAADKVLSHP